MSRAWCDDSGEVGQNVMGQQVQERVVEVSTGGNSISDIQLRQAEAKRREEANEGL